jgi:hypothetical protein
MTNVLRSRFRFAAPTGLIALVFVPIAALAQTAPSLGAAQSFAVLAGSAVTNTGATVVTGNLGVNPGSAVTGFPPGLVVSGTIHAADASALAAQNSAITAYDNLTSQGCTQDLTGQDLGGRTLTAGVYCFAAAAQLTGTLTLDAQGNPNAVFIFKIGSSLTTASSSSVLLLNSASACNVFWQVGSSATLGTSSSLAGTILALTSITVTTGGSVTGRALARNGAVTLDTSTVTAACATVSPTCPTITLSPLVLPNRPVGLAFSQTLAATGGTAPYTFSVAGGALPAGTTLTPGGVLAGTPSVAGPSAFTVRATDANGCFVEVAYTLVITPIPPTCPTITLSPLVLPNRTVAVAFSQTLVATGGTAPYTFSVIAGTLPAGTTLTTGGVLAGTPTVAGTSTFTVRATDANGCLAEVAYTVVITAIPPTCPALTLSPSVLPNGRVAVAYTQTILASGGSAPYSFALATGALPAGITMAPAGELVGTPTLAATASFTVRATDANGCTVSVAYTFTVLAALVPPGGCPLITLAPATLPNGTTGVPYSQTLSASGGSGPYSFGVTVGTLPAGLTLTAAGLLSGTPSSSGSSSFSVRATDANGCFADRVFALPVLTPVPTLPQLFVVLLALGLVAAGVAQLRRRRA